MRFVVKGAIFPIITAILFSLVGVCARFLGKNFAITTDILFFFGCFFSTISFFLLKFMKCKDISVFKINWKQFLYSFVLGGIVCLFMANILSLTALNYIDTGIQKIIGYSDLFFVVAICLIFFRYKIKFKNIISAVFVLVGLLLIVGKIDMRANKNFAIGCLFAISSTLTNVFYYFMVDFFRVEMDDEVYWSYAFLSSTICSFLLLVCTKEVHLIPVYFSQADALFYLFFAAIIIYAVPYFTYLISLRRNGTVVTSIFLSLTPALTVIEGYLFLNEHLTSKQFIGITCILLASIINATNFSKITVFFSKRYEKIKQLRYNYNK